MKKIRISLAAALLVLAFAISTAGAKPALAANAGQVSAGWMPFAGSLYDLQTDSSININGLVHIVARWQSVSDSQVQVDISANLPEAGVSVTSNTGIPYSAFGGGQSSSIFLPPNPIFPTNPLRVYVPSFLLVTVGSDRPLPPNPVLPPNPILPFSFTMQFDLVFSAAGVLDFNASTVKVTQLPPIDGG